ncbi:MAG: dihydrofolate reductase family protein [Tepidisphaeraceae bacterium]
MLSDHDIRMLLRAERIAMNGRGKVEPNPMVGCVLQKNGQTIGEGWHLAYGQSHAEPTALADCAVRGNSPEGATAYVTLEPCCHTNKKTPPCAPRLIAAKVAHVVIGCLDPNPDVNGNGVAMLRAAGIEVEELPDSPPLEGGAGGGVASKVDTFAHSTRLEPVPRPPTQPSPSRGEDCSSARFRQLISPFTLGLNHRRPYVTMKWAQTSDGKVAGAFGDPVKITGDKADHAVHALRSRCDAIAVGTNTVVNDDPSLTVRHAPPMRLPIRVVLSNTLAFPPHAKLMSTADDVPTIVYTCDVAAIEHHTKVDLLRDEGVEVVALPTHETPDRPGPGRFSFDDVLRDLYARKRVAHLLIEPGPTLVRQLLSRGQADRVWVFRSDEPMGDDDGLAIADAPPIDYAVTGSVRLGPDVLTEYLNPTSVAFHAAVPSADFVLTRESPDAR